MNKKGFTIIELLIVIAVSAMLAAIAIVYTRSGQSRVALSVEAAKISGFMLRAKELAVATYSGSGASCGYGVAFDITNQTYSIFSYNPAGAPPCPRASNIVSIAPSDIASSTPGTWNVPMPPGVIMQSGSNCDSIQYVLFYPPAPTVFLVDNGLAGFAHQTSYVYLSTTDGNASEVITVNQAGQVTL
jgi:prepilin-type N-terminal cleavage/methylation domain-containing protein